MNWNAIGAVGEVAGAIGVLITLIYLAFQIRQNSVLLQHSIQQSTAQNVLGQFMIFQDSFTREAVLKSFHLDEPISIEQASAAEAFIMGAMASLQSQYHNHRIGLASEEEWNLTKQMIPFYFTTSWPRAWWEMASGTYDPQFAEQVTKIIESTKITGSHLVQVQDRTEAIRAGA